MISSEAAPFAKTGGLSDVVGALPAALNAVGHEVTVLVPRYAETQRFPTRRIWDRLPVRVGSTEWNASILQSEDDARFLFLDIPELYDRAGLYGNAAGDYPDNPQRFAALARGALEVARRIFLPDLFHCHDWQSGLVPVYQRQLEGDPTFTNIPVIATIHNLGYQGIFPRGVLGELGIDERFYTPDGLEFFDQVDFLKAGLAFSDALTTVSPRYAEEIQTPEFGFGLDGLLRSRSAVLTGILNGVDYEQWNPETDPLIPAQYSASNLKGKAQCKSALLDEFGLKAKPGLPLIGIVSRFASQKGLDLIAAAAPDLFSTENFQLVALGSGELKYEELFRNLASEFPDRVGVKIGYDNGLAHRIEAGSDLFLMPSRYEPCGLNQIYSLRYGTIPVVRATGGLDDTVDAETGFKFKPYTPEALAESVREALAAYGDKTLWNSRITIGMSRDFSWGASAREYSRLYQSVLTR